MTSPAGSPSRRPGWWYPYIFVAAFLVVLAVNLIMARSAIQTFSGLETDQAYQKGLEYNRALAAAEAQKTLGWTADVDIRPSNLQANSLVVSVGFLDRDGKPVDDLTVDAEFVRPTVAGHDSRQGLSATGGGRYQAEVSLPFPGVWDMRVVARRGDLTYQLAKRIRVP